MENTAIFNHSDLLLRLEELKSKRDMQQEELKISITGFIATIDIVSFFKKKSGLSNDEPQELLKTGLNMALNLITGLIFGKNRSIKGYLSALMVERFTSMVVDNNLINIITGISSLIFRNRNQNRYTE
jgi:hypothetical protein